MPTKAQLQERVTFLEGLLAEVDHPIRMQIRAWLQSQAKLTGSPVEFARDSQMSLGVASYHFRILYRDGVVKLARVRPVRGATEHFYRLVA